MKQTVKHILLLVGITIMVTLGACTSIDCPVQNVVRTVYRLKKGGEVTDTLRDTTFIFTRRADGTDTLLLGNAIGLTIFSLPMGYGSAEDTLYFQFRNTAYSMLDTVVIEKRNIPHFESVDCSVSFFHFIQGVRTTHHAIDSINIHDSSVNYDASTEHFYLYLKHRN
jgi:hypothetical protein